MLYSIALFEIFIISIFFTVYIIYISFLNLLLRLFVMSSIISAFSVSFVIPVIQYVYIFKALRLVTNNRFFIENLKEHMVAVKQANKPETLIDEFIDKPDW